MRTTALEYRLRFPLQALILLLGFWSFWEPWLGLSEKSTWLTFSAALAQAGWLGFRAATVVLLVVATLFAALGAWFRVWAAAYPAVSVAKSTSMDGEVLLAAGPFRYTRNPSNLGTLFHTFGLALLMPPAGAILAIAGIWIFQVRSAFAKEALLETQFGRLYGEYKERVPRFLPSSRPRVPCDGVAEQGARGQWGQACLRQIYFFGVVTTMLCFGWDFNVTPLLQGVLISLGAGIIAQALLPTFPSSSPVKI